jgi:hypothetical protein
MAFEMIYPCHFSIEASMGRILLKVGHSENDNGDGKSNSCFFLLFLLFTGVVSMVLMPESQLRCLSLAIFLEHIQINNNRGGWRLWAR